MCKSYRHLISEILVFLMLGYNLFSQSSITGLPINNTYCTNDPVDTLYGHNPGTKLFYGAGITNLSPGVARFNPATAGVGPHTITYDNPARVTVIITVSAFPSTTLTSFSPVCIDAASFALTGGSPAGGTYSGTGVDALGNFNPSVAGAGVHAISYTNSVGTCSSTAVQNITVYALPSVSLASFPEQCQGGSPIVLNEGTPAGGTYSGTGISGGGFYPTVSGTGTFPITYTYSNGYCTSSASGNITVNPLPTVIMNGLASSYCIYDTPAILTGTPTNSRGQFSGTGIFDNGDGTAGFNPSVAGWGNYTITYTYTDANSCVNSTSQSTRVGTALTLNGLNAQYCVSETSVNIVATPSGGIYTPIAGLTDNGDGTAVFNPSVSGVGNHTIVYTYTDMVGCTNSISRTVDVIALPNPAFALASVYCAGSAPITLTGNYAPSGTFSGLGITDIGNGTATFNPSALAIGGPYNITYTYNSPGGCSAASTRQTIINPLPTATISGTATICNGNSTPLSIALTGAAPYSFSYSDGIVTTNVVGNATNSYSTNVSPTTTSTYSVTSVTDANTCSNSGSGSAVITVNPLVSITTQPASRTVCPGSNTSFSVIAGGVGLTYQWQKNGVNILGATSSVLTLNNVGVGDVANYRCIVSSTCGGPLTSNSAALSLYTATSITTQPTGDYLCSGENLNLSVAASGSNLGYQWRKDGVNLTDNVIINGSLTSSLTISNVATSDAGMYTCLVTGSCGTLESNPAIIQVDAPIVITTQPASKMACPGSNNSFAVTATGTSLSYQWQKDGVNLPGQISQSLILNSVVAGDAGTYRCVVSSPCGATLNSQPATLTLNTATTITVQPVDVTQCAGGNAGFSITAGGSSLSFQWYKSGVALTDGAIINGSQTNTLIFTGLGVGDAGQYLCTVTGSCGTLNSLPANLIVDNAISILTQPATQQACEGNNVAFSVAASGSNLSYQWQKNLVNIPGANLSTLALNSLSAADAGNFRCIISNSCGSVLNSNTVSLTINPQTAITLQPVSVTECVGNNVNFSVNVTGTGLSYQWYKNAAALVNGGDISGAGSQVLSISNLDNTDAATYYCHITGACGSLNSDPAVLTVSDSVAITTIPQDIQACSGDNVSFSVVATGSGLTFQWQKNTVNIAGATNTVLNLNGIVAGDAAAYRCVVTNSCGTSLTSQSANLTINTNTSITLQPVDVTQCTGANANLIVAATGNNLSFQWKKAGVNLINGGNVSGALSNSLTLTGLVPGDNSVYTCEVSGSCGTINSNPANLLVRENTSITVQPSSQTVCEGGNAVFSVTASGSNLSYQWQKDGVNIPGAISSGYLINNIATADAGVFRCVVTGDCGSVNSNGALLAVSSSLAIVTHPLPATVCENNPAGFSITVTGSSPVYQWRLNGTNLADGGSISGVTTQNLSINPTAAMHNGTISCVVTGTCNSVTGNTVSLIVNNYTIITSQPVNQTACPNDDIVFSISATGTNPSYQWQKDGINIPGETNSSLLLSNVTTASEGLYRCLVTGICGSQISNAASLSINQVVTINSNPSNTTVCEGNSAGFTVMATGTGLSYQWKRNGADLADGGTISGATTNNLTISLAVPADAGSYTCAVTGLCGTENTTPATLTVNENITITSQPQGLSVCPGDDAIISVVATGSNLTYQWLFDGVNMPGQTNSGLLLNNITAVNAGTYQCLISGNCGTLVSAGAILTVSSDVLITGQPADVETCEGNVAGFVIAASGSGLSYQWKRNNVNLVDGGTISGANTNSLGINTVSISNNGIYTCEVTGTCGAENSNPANLIINNTISITSQPSNLTVCPGNNAGFTILVSGSNLNYQWQKDGVNIAGETANGLTLTSVNAGDGGIYRCIVTGDCGTLISNGATLTVDQDVAITSQPVSNPVLCQGDNLSVSVSASGTSLIYQWSKDGVALSNGGNISGAAGNNLLITGTTLANDGIYNCTVSGTCGSANSNLSDVVINPATSIVTQPVSYTIVSGGDALFSVLASGSGLSYQWQKDGVNLADGGIISGAQTSILNLTGVSATDAGAYRCLVTGTCNTINSNPANLTVNPTTNITIQPVSISRCVGSGAAFTIIANGSGNTYQWRKDGVNLSNTATISGAATANLNISSVSLADAGAYTCIVNSESSAPAILTVNENTIITVQPVGSYRCEGDILVMNITSVGSALSYQWQSGGVNLTDDALINGSVTSTLSINPVSVSHSGNYRCVVNGTCGTANSNPATLVVYQNTYINSQPSGGTICEGSSHTFSVVVTGNNLSYVWRKDGAILSNGGNISGAETPDLTIANATLSDAGAYTCTITGSCGAVTSNIAQLVVNASTSITSQPVNQHGCAGDNISFSVLSNGTGLSYQWQKDGANLLNAGNISGAQSANLIITGLIPGNTGTYVCIVSGTCGIQNSAPAVLSSFVNTVITSQPAGNSVCEGQTLTLQVAATGNNLTYQWSKDGAVLTNSGNITGAQTASLNIANALLSNSGTYTCEVTGDCGSETSNLAVVTVRPTTDITVEPVSATGCTGDNVSFSVVANGSGLTYQWQQNGTNLTDVAPFSGSATSILNITGITTSESASYRCVVTGACGTDNSNPAILNSYQNTLITSQPVGGTICENANVSLTVAATGNNLSYQWKKDGVNIVNDSHISGVNTSVLTINSAIAANLGTYSCEVTGSCGTENSTPASVTVETTTQILVQPISVNACIGNNASFSVLAAGTNLSYQWQKDGVNLLNGAEINGVNTALLQLSSVGAVNAGIYRCIVTGNCGIQNSNPAQLVVNVNTQITAQPTGSTVCSGSQVTLSITSTGNNLLYQWKKDGVNLSDGANISGALTANFLINNSLSSNTGIYSCSVAGTCGTDNSSSVIVTVHNTTIITEQPQNATYCEGGLAVLRVVASGVNLSYQWQKNGVTLADGGNIFGSATSVLTLSNLIAADAGAYRCVITGTCGSVNSDAANLAVNVYPGVAGSIIGTPSVCQGASNIVFEIPAIANASSYIWNLPVGVSILSGNGTRLIEVAFANNELGGNITVQGSNTCGTGTLSPAYLVIANPIPIALAGADQNLCTSTTTLNAADPGAANGIWAVTDGPAIVQNINQYNSPVINLRQGTNTFVWSVSQSGCSSSDTVIIRNNYVDVEAGTNQTICTQSVVLEGSTVPSGATGSWSVTHGAASFQNGTSPSTSASGFATGVNVLRWTVTNANCIQYDSVIIDNQMPTVAYAGIDQSLCRDFTTLSGSAPVVGTGNWNVITGAAIFSNTNSATSGITGLAKGSNILRWTISNGICSSIDEVTINNNQVTINAGIDQILCDRTTNLDAAPPTTGTGNWSVIQGAASFVNINLNNTRVTGLAKGLNILGWNINNNGCISRDTVYVTNDAPSDADAGTDQTITADFTTLQGNIPAVGTGSWSLINGSAVIDNLLLYNTNVTSLGLGQNIFRWTISHNSCISFDDVTITNYMTTETNAGSDQTICSSSTTLSANVPQYGFGEWSVIQGSAVFADNSKNNTVVSGLAQGDNILRWTVWEGGYTYDDVVISNDMPTQADAGSNQVLCSASSTLAANEPIVGTGKWTVTSGAGQFANDTLYNSQITNLSKGQNIFKWTITNKSCITSDLVEIRNDLPTAAYAGTDQTLCTDSTILYPNTPSVGNGSWSIISGAATFNGNQVTQLAQGNNTLRWTITNYNCQLSDEILLINNKPSLPQAGSDKTICTDSLNLAANTPVVGIGVWSIQNGSATIANSNSATSKVTGIGQGLNVFRWTISNNGCILSDEVVIKNSIIKANAGLTQNLCSETTILEANNPEAGTGMWSVLGGSGSAIFEDPHQPDTRVRSLDKGSNILRWTIVNDICTSTSDVTINNNLPSDAFAGPDQALCSNNTTLQANTPSIGTGQWSVLSGSATIQQSSTPVSPVINLEYGVNTLRWTVTNQGCSSSDEVVIKNNSAVQSVAGTNQTICADSTVLYGNEPPFGTGQWSVVSGSATFIDNHNFNTQVTNLSSGTNILKWSITNGICTSSGNVTIVNNSPTAAIAGADFTVCGDLATMQANTPSIGTGQWSLISGAAVFSSSGSPNTQVNSLNAGQNVLRWTISNLGCNSFDDVVVTNDLPYKANAGDDIEVCGDSVTLYANDPVSGIGQWSLVSGSGTFENSSLFDSKINGLGFGNNTLRWTITYDRCVTSDEIIIKNNHTKVYAGIDQVVGESQTLLAATNPSVGTGEWLVIGGAGNFTSQENSITEVTNLGAGLNSFRWTVTINGCVSYDDVSVTYNVPPEASFVVSTNAGCPPLEVYFVNNSLDGLPFIWNFGDGESSDDATTKHTYTDAGLYTASLQIIGTHGEIVNRDTLITVYDQPEASLLVVNHDVYIPEEEALFINTSTYAVNYLWDFGDGGESTDKDPRHIYADTGLYDITLQVWSEHQCFDSAVMPHALQVIRSGTIQFPNAFTPNLQGSSGGVYNPQDFSNDVFFPIGEGIAEYHLEIFNKWSVLVFDSYDINIGWDGYYQDKLLNEGVYVWKVTGKYNDGRDFKKVGTVLLLH